MPYIDINTGIIQLPSEVTWDNVANFLAILRHIDLHAAAEDITLHITALGGSGLAATAIAQALRTCRKPVHTIGTGYIASSAVTVLAAGTPGRRSAVEGSLMMLHEARLPGDVDHTKGLEVAKLAVYASEMARRVTQQYEELERLTRRPASFWRKQVEGRPDWFISPAEAVELGLIDQVITPSSLRA